ncbi:hypothetical protein ACTFIZ_008834 [Dictyostelium cf. discoideum]
MDSVKIKCKESFSSFGSFPKDFPVQLQRNLSQTEFESIINRINNACKSSFNKGFLFFFLGPVAGIALIIIGIVRWRKLVAEFKDNYDDFGGYGFGDYSAGDYSVGETIMDVSNKNSFKPNMPFFYFVIGIALFLIGCILFCCFYLIFKRKVLGKIENELVPLNSMYSERMITFNLKDETEKEYIPEYEYRIHSNNQAYMNNVKFDKDGNPYKEIEVHYLYITFPINPTTTQNYPTIQPPMYSITPGIEPIQQNQFVEMNVINN